MISSPMKKVIADLLSNKARSILVVLSIAVGVFAVGVVANTFSQVKKDMAADYSKVNPHTARLYTSEFDDSILESIRSVTGVEGVEARYNIWLEIEGADDKEYPINIDSIGPLDEILVDQLEFQEGAPEVGDGEIYLERQGASGLGIEIGESATLVLNSGEPLTLKVVGTVHDVIANPFNFSSSTSGYVTSATMSKLGGSSLNNFVSLVTSSSHTDADHIRAIAEEVAERLSEEGIIVYNINITNPGQHPAQSIIDTVLLLLQVLCVLVILLSGFLVTNTVSALMGQQIRQVGVMKAVGATIGQIIWVYLQLALAFGLLSLLVGIPLSGVASYVLARWLIGMLNATPSPFAISSAALVAQLFVGIAVPVFGSLIPIWGGARRTIREAITSYGLQADTKRGFFDAVLEKIPQLSRPLILSLRNTFRRKSRLVLTLATLILGGAIFIAMFGVKDSLYREIDQTHGYYQSDVNVDFVQNYSLSELEGIIEELPGVEVVEGWKSLTANVVHADGNSSDQILMYAPPESSKVINPIMIDGRWLTENDSNAIVVSNQLIDLRPDIEVGNKIEVLIDEQAYEYDVVGIFRVAGTFPSPMTFVPQDYLGELMGASGLVNGLRIVADRHDLDRQEQVLGAVEEALKDYGIQASLKTGGQIIAQQRYQIDLLINLLLAMGFLIAVVGGLGLMGTMGMNVLERTREIGVMRSIGAENGAIFQLMATEGILIGGISWILSALAAIPVTFLLDQGLGERLMNVPIVFVFSYTGMVLWLAIALILSVLASIVPARNAIRLTVRDVLAYE